MFAEPVLRHLDGDLVRLQIGSFNLRDSGNGHEFITNLVGQFFQYTRVRMS